MSQLNIDVKKTTDDTEVLLVCVGDIDASTVGDLDNTITVLLSNGAKNLIVDITDVVYAASRALGVFIGAQKELSDRDGCLVLVNPSEAVRTSLEILGFDDLFDITSDEAAALEIIRGKA